MTDFESNEQDDFDGRWIDPVLIGAVVCVAFLTMVAVVVERWV